MSDLFIIGKPKTALCRCSIQARASECVELALKGQTCILEATEVCTFKTGTEEAGAGVEGSACFTQMKARGNSTLPVHDLLQNKCWETGVSVDVNT